MFIQDGGTLDRVIVTGYGPDPAIRCESDLVVRCTDIWGNAGGDWQGCVAEFAGQDGNISADPLLCSPSDEDFHLQVGSPCSPELSPPGCGQIGAFPVGCGTVSVTPTTFGRIKAAYRDGGRR